MDDHFDPATSSQRPTILDMLLDIENVKEAIRLFEDGEANLHDAWKQIMIVLGTRSAA